MRTVYFRLLSLTAVCAIALLSAQPGNAVQNAEVVSAGRSSVVFELDLSGYELTPSGFIDGAQVLTVPGFGSFSAPGEPHIPAADFLVGIPQGVTASVSAVVLESKPLGQLRLEPVPFPIVFLDDGGSPTASQEVRIDPDVYDGVSSSFSARAQRQQRFRRQHVLPVRVTPLTYDAATGEAVLATRIQVSVSFSGANRAPFDDAVGTLIEDVTWERIYARTLVNAEQARAWRVQPVRPRFDGSSAAAAATAGPLIKLKVFDDGVHKVRASTAIGKGFPASTPVSELHVFKRGYDAGSMSATVTDVPHIVIEDGAGQSGVFDGDDFVVFFGQRLMNDALEGDPIEKFSWHNLYWLGSSGGTTMASKSVATGSVRADTASASFEASGYFETDLIFQEETPPGVTDFYYENVPQVNRHNTPFQVHAPAPNGTFTIEIEILGTRIPSSEPNLRDLIPSLPSTSTALSPIFMPERQLTRGTTLPVSNTALRDGNNTLRLESDASHQGLQGLLNWFRVDYDALYRADGNRLEFTNGGRTGSTDLSIIGFGRDDVMLFDVTDPLGAQQCQLTAAHFTAAGNGYVLTFNENFSGDRRYIATTVDKMAEIAAADIIEDEPSQIIGNAAESGVDVLVVSHGDFLGEMQRWVDHRRAQGYRVYMVDVQDVMDEFRGGLTDPRAIRDFVNRFYTMGNASFLLLVGDNNEDTKRVYSFSSPTKIPSESYSEYVFGGGFDEDEVVTTDKWYVMLDYDHIRDEPPNLNDYYPDLIMGRLPVDTVGELRVVLDKIFKFEAPQADDFWRRRVIRAADDAWAFGGNFQSCYNAAEVGFQTGEASAANRIEQSWPGGYDVVRFWLSEKIEHPPIGQCIDAGITMDRTRLNATPDLFAELNAGASWVSINCHMNRYQWCHEFLFTASLFAPDGNRDHPRLKNFGRPWVVLGMGCHFSDYAIHANLTSRRQNESGPTGDAFAELLLHLEDRGAVGTYGSSGFEYLSTEQRHTGIIMEETFENTPTDNIIGSNKSQARWIFGELITASEITNINRWGSIGPALGAWGQALRMHLLGDPLLRIDAGPPRFDVTVDGQPVQNDDPIFGGEGDPVQVVAVIRDEVAIEDIELEIAGVDRTADMTVTPLDDAGKDASRTYQVEFSHQIRPESYDIIIRASQAENPSGGYHLAAEFTLKVVIDVELTADGRQILSGDVVPRAADFQFSVRTSVPIDPGLVSAQLDGEDVTNLQVEATDTLVTAGFSATLGDGNHKITLNVNQDVFSYDVEVRSQAGLTEVVNYPNPFVDETHFIFTTGQSITSGSIDIFTVSGRRVMTLDIPAGARAVGQNTVRWDGRTWSGDEVANGVYLYVFKVTQQSGESVHRGRLVRAK